MDSSIRSADGERDETSFQDFQFERPLERSRLIEEGFKVAVENTLHFIDRIAAECNKYILERMTSTSKEQNPKQEPLTFENFLKIAEEFPIRFDAQGKPLFEIVVPAALKQQISSWNRIPEYRRRYNELLDRKREQYKKIEEQRRLED